MNSSGTRLILLLTVLFVAAIVFAIFKPSKEVDINDLQPRFVNHPYLSEPALSDTIVTDSLIFPVAQPQVNPATHIDSEANFFIIIGSSKSHDLALQNADNLKKKYGADIFVLPPTGEGYYRISFGRYYTHAEAESKLGSVRSVAGPDAWIFSMK